MKNKIIFTRWNVCLLALACWPVFQWYLSRVSDATLSKYALIPMALLCVIILQTSKSIEIKSHQLTFACAALATYVCMFTYVPPLISAVCVFVALGSLISLFVFGQFYHMGIFCLSGLSLPILDTIEFYTSYPLRRLIGICSQFVLSFYVPGLKLEGLNFMVGQQIVCIDDPCSGIKMFWSLMLATSALVVWLGIQNKHAWYIFLYAGAITLVMNVFRSVSLFFLESKNIPTIKGMHSAIGLICFSLGVMMIWGLIYKLGHHKKGSRHA